MHVGWMDANIADQTITLGQKNIILTEDLIGFNLFDGLFDLCQSVYWIFSFKACTFFSQLLFIMLRFLWYMAIIRIQRIGVWNLVRVNLFYFIRVVNKMDECKLNEPRKQQHCNELFSRFTRFHPWNQTHQKRQPSHGMLHDIDVFYSYPK